jgi:hypothetical protein
VTDPGKPWLPIETMPEGATALTRIFDEKGERNVQPLTKQGRLFFTGEPNSMYVYYTPTHWRKP